MLLLIVMMFGISLPSCSEAVKKADQMIRSGLLSGPVSGNYFSETGGKFKIITTGPSPLTIQGEDRHLCLQFWKEKDQPNEEITRLQGQDCNNKKFGNLDWSAVFSKSKQNKILLYPPGVFSVAGVKPIELTLESAE